VGHIEIPLDILLPVIPAGAGIQTVESLLPLWIPAFAGMTGRKVAERRGAERN
jgi:hypothetical protein